MTATGDLIEVLSQRQEAERLTDEEFAARLGISRQMWGLVRNRKRFPGRRTLGKIIEEFPEYRHLAAFFVIERATNMSDSATVRGEEEAVS